MRNYSREMHSGEMHSEEIIVEKCTTHDTYETLRTGDFEDGVL